MSQTATNVQAFPAKPGHSALYGKLYELLRTTTADTLTDEAIASEVGEPCSVGTKGYGTLLRVCEALRRNEGICWSREPSAGCIQRRTSEYIAKAAPNRLQSIKRHVARVGRFVACAKLTELSDGDKTKLLTSQAMLAAAAMTVDTKTTKKLEARMNGTPPDAASVFKLFGA